MLFNSQEKNQNYFPGSHHVRKSAIPDKGKPQNSTHPPTLASGNSSEIKVNEKQKLVSPVTTPVATTASPKSRTTTVIVNQQKSFIPNSSIDLKPSSNVISEVKLEGKVSTGAAKKEKDPSTTTVSSLKVPSEKPKDADQVIASLEEDY